MWKANAKGGGVGGRECTGRNGRLSVDFFEVTYMQFPASPEVENFNGLTINKIIVTNMHNQKYLMEDKVKDEDDDPLKDKRCFQSFIIYMFMYMY